MTVLESQVNDWYDMLDHREEEKTNVEEENEAFNNMHTVDGTFVKSKRSL